MTLVYNYLKSYSHLCVELIDIRAEQYPLPYIEKQSEPVREECFNLKADRPTLQEIILKFNSGPIEQEFFSPVDRFITGNGRNTHRKENSFGWIG